MKIETNVPMQLRNKYNWPTMEQIKSMKVGHSFLMQGCVHGGSVSTQLIKYSTLPGYRFTTKREGNALRIWRKE